MKYRELCRGSWRDEAAGELAPGRAGRCVAEVLVSIGLAVVPTRYDLRGGGCLVSVAVGVGRARLYCNRCEVPFGVTAGIARYLYV